MGSLGTNSLFGRTDTVGKIFVGSYIMEYGSTPYVGMARKKMAAPYNAYKIIRSELGFDYSHRLL